MRPRLFGALAAALAAATATTALVTGITTTAHAAPAANAAGYTWQNVAIGGGGFVPGIEFNPGQANLVYARTDIGGAYRWNQASGTWTPLLDWVGQSDWGHNGVVSIAPDPVHPGKVFAAVGMYTNSWDPNDGAVLRSADQGATWQVTALPFKLGGNMPGRGMGERLVVDPNDDNVLYLGTPSGNGLWRSTDAGVTWAKVASFPNAGDYAPNPSDTTGYNSDNEGVVWEAFDQGTGTAGSPTQGIYVGVADLQNTVYRSTDGGATWSRIAGQPTGFIAHKGLVDPVNHQLYLATSNTGGPYDGSSGQVWRYATATGTWTDISPYPSSDTSDNYYGYSGLALDPEHPGTVMVTGYSSWWPDTFIWRSTTGGATWKQIWNWTSYPNRAFSYTLDVSSVPWLAAGGTPTPPVTNPKLGWMTEGLSIDPFDSNRMMYGTGATLFGTTNLTNWDSGGTVTIRPMVAGLEETAVNALISPPSGPPLVSGLGDIGGFVHTDVTKVPSVADDFSAPTLTTTDSLDFAESNPAVMVRTGEIDRSANPNVNRIGFTTDGGKDWFQGQEFGGVTGGGTAAVAADGSATVWAPAGAAVSYSTSYGGSWTASAGVPQGAAVASDRVNPRKFYALSGGTLYASTDGGATFTAAATGLPSSVAFVKAVAGHEGDVWVTGGTGSASGIYHSTDSGTTFTRLATVPAATNLGFGKAAPGKGYPALYAIAQVGGTRGVYRSDDTGATWVRINDDQHQYGNIGQAITGDPRIYGRVYVGTNGRGIVYGDLTSGGSGGGTTTTTTTTTTTPPTTTSPGSGACHVTYTKAGEWPGGFTANVTVSDPGPAPLTNWSLTFTFPGDQKVTSAWNATVTQTGAAVTAVGASYQATIAPGGSASFGFQGTWTANDASPAAFAVNGTGCS
jgi:xyloglucan-specific exo-beta-1,4-glucanase